MTKPLMIPISIFASGRGSGFDAICAAIDSGRLAARVTSVVSDRADAPVLEKARARGVSTHLIPFPASSGSSQGSSNPRHGDSDPGGSSLANRRLRHDEEIFHRLTTESPRFLVMAGYMRMVSPLLLDAYRSERGYSRIVNIHPSLLPAFPGVGGYAQAFEHGCAVAGVTVHLVDSNLDSGPICVQEAFSISDCQCAQDVEERGLKVEHRLYPSALAWILPEKFEMETRTDLPTRRPCVRPN